MSPEETISRIVRVEIEGVRGFRKAGPFNLDADVVLLTGGNGLGKSSLVDIVSLVANGGPDPRVRASWVFAGADRHEVRAKVARGNTVEDEVVPLTKGVEWRRAGFCEAYSLATTWCDGFGIEPWGEKKKQESWIRQIVRHDLVEKDALAGGLRALRERLRTEAKAWPLPGVEPDDVLARDMKAAVDRLNRAWKQASERYPQDLGVISLLIRNGNISRSAWGQLGARANVLLKGSGFEVGDVDERTPRKVLLDRLFLAVSQFSRNRKALRPQHSSVTPLRSRQQFMAALGHGVPIAACVDESHVTNLPLGAVALALTDSAAMAVCRHLEDLAARTQSIKEQIARERHSIGVFGATSCNRGLDSVLKDLMEGAGRWTGTPLPPSGQPPPEDVLDWVRSAEQWRSPVDHRRLDERFGDWSRAVESALAGHEKEAQETIEACSRQEFAADIAKTIRTLFPQALERLKGLPRPTDAATIWEALQTAVQPAPEPDIDPGVEVLEEVAAAVASLGKVFQRMDERDQALASAPASRAARSCLHQGEELLDTIERIADDALEVPSVHLARVSDVINRVLSEFRVADFLPHLGFSNAWRLVFDTPEYRTELDNLSTGQRCLVGMAQMLALNLVMEPLLPHRVILLDDFTTSLDVAQIPAAARLIRGLAYGGHEAPDQGVRRQVIVTSHHEDLTNRLLDYLSPPSGCSMRVLEFRGWSVAEGPQVDQYLVEPLPASTDKDQFGNLFEPGLRRLSARHEHASRTAALPTGN